MPVGPTARETESRPFTLVLSGGGLKGLAHIGVLRALGERELTPSLVIGSSIGSLVSATWAAGMPVEEMHRLAAEVRRRDIFQVAHVDMALRRMLSPAVYRREPLETLIRGLVGDVTFDDLIHPLLINTVDLNSGMQVLWGLPGLRDVAVADAVFASCALPGIFPPREILGRHYVDGAVIENLPVRGAAVFGRGPIVAVNVAATSILRSDVEKQGFAATYIRGLEIVMQVQIESQLRGWDGPPLVLVEPKVDHISMFAFDRSEELIEEGYRATRAALDALGGDLDALERGMHPRRKVRLQVDGARCIGCGMCVSRAPEVFQTEAGGKVRVIAPEQVWSPLDGKYVRDCPTGAIDVEPMTVEQPPTAA